MKNMKVAVMEGVGRMGFTERPVPVPRDDEVLVKIEYVGICGSDLHYFEYGRIGDAVVKPPFVLGHEAGGVVIETGSSVSALRPGDRVALEPGIACGHCEYCKKGKYNLCPGMVFFSSAISVPPVDGVFREYVAHKADLCFPLPASVSTLEGALIEPLSVGMHAAGTADAEAGETAAVFGSGCIGLVSLLALRSRGVSSVYLIDAMPNRLEKARELGAAAAINFRESDPVEVVNDLTNGRGVDLVIETSGSAAAVNQAMRLIRKGCPIVLVGNSPTGDMTLDISYAIKKELSLRAIFRYRHTYPAAINIVAAGNSPVKKIVTNTYAFDDIQTAMEQSISNKAEIVKAVIKVDPAAP